MPVRRLHIGEPILKHCSPLEGSNGRRKIALSLRYSPDWFDPLEAGVRTRIRSFIEERLEAELEAALGRKRYARGRTPETEPSTEAARSPVSGHRHGHRERTQRFMPRNGTSSMLPAQGPERSDRVKILAYDGTGLILATKRLEEGRFTWPPIQGGVVRLDRGAILHAGRWS